jgi:DNA-binding response OmpR family regulator
LKILIVDDSPGILEKMKEIVSQSGYTVFTARDGTEGLGELILGGVDIVIADLNMPRMDGLTMIEFFYNIQKENIPTIMLTTVITPELVARGKKMGINAWFQKPLNRDAVLKTLEKIKEESFRKK